MIRLHCEHCGAHLKVPEDQIGRPLGCPKCRKKIHVPGSEPSASPPAIPPMAPPVVSPATPPIGSASPPSAPPMRQERQLDAEPPAIPEHLRSPSRKLDGASPARSSLSPEQEAIVHRVIDSLIRAASASKMAFFGLGTVASFLVTIGLSVIVVFVSSLDAASTIVLFLVSILVWLGMAGVVAGGVAFMFRQERKGRPGGIAAGMHFCAKRFSVLFVDTVAVLLIAVVLFVGLNLTIAQLARNAEVGSLLTGALFVPQVVCNLLLLLALLSCVLVPCIVAATDVGSFGAFKRFFQYLVRHGRSLLIHFAASFCFGIQIFLVVLPLLLLAIGFTLKTNAPAMLSSAGLFQSGEDAMLRGMSEGSNDSDDDFSWPSAFGSGEFPGGGSQGNSESGQDHTPWGDGLRWISMAIVVFVPFCYFCVFWIGSFMRFSEDLENPSDPARDIKVSVSVDQDQGSPPHEVTA